MTRRVFEVTWDYRCPFARIAHEHLLEGLDAGAPWDVRFVPFFLNQSHVPEGGTPAWEDPAAAPDLLALAAGAVVADRDPDHFRAVHRALFDARHGRGLDLRDRAVVAAALTEGGADADAVLADVDGGAPAKAVRAEHERVVNDLDVFGVPTFIVGDRAVFVRLMDRPGPDPAASVATIERILDLVADHPELNEFKHTRIAR